jgi:predicted metalloprotease with PDZ domain
MHQNFGYQRVYWGGAAVAFAIDVAVRKDSNGEKSLDDAMRFLRECCGEAKHKWDADALLGKLDTWYGKPIFSETAQPLLAQEEFPDVEAIFTELGIDTFAGRMGLDDAHPMAAQRRAMMAPRKD